MLQSNFRVERIVPMLQVGLLSDLTLRLTFLPCQHFSEPERS